MIINGINVPPVLLKAIATGRWRVPEELGKICEVFNRVDVFHPLFYDVRMLIFENAGWAKETDEVYIGKPDNQNPPGDIDPSRSLLIGDLGPDNCIALDFRGSDTEPIVVYLTGNEKAKWIMVAPSFQKLLEMLNL